MRSSNVVGSTRAVVVSPFSPLHDGTAKYSDQLVETLRQTRAVLPVGLPGSGTKLTRRLDGGLRPLHLLALTRRGDDVLVLWHPQYFISGRAWSRAGAYLSLGVVLRLRHGAVDVQVAEMPFVPAHAFPRRLVRGFEEAARRFFWRSPGRVVFHSRWERDRLLERFPGLPARIEIVPNGATYRPYVEASKSESRARLGVTRDALLFLCIGFIGWTKGFDRAVDAFARAAIPGAELKIVGSIPYETDREVRYVESLQRRVDQVNGASMQVAWVEDEEFDLWLQAADVVVAPYRDGATSGVIARAKLYGRPVIASRVAGIPEQLGPGDVIIDSDADLAEALKDLGRRVT